MAGLTGMGGGYDPRSRDKAITELGKGVEENLDTAVKEVLDEQADLGVEVVTDGEMERGAYYIHLMNNIQGIDMTDLEEKKMRSGAYSTLVPVVRGKVDLKGGETVCWREWKRAQGLASDNVTVKYTIPGPMTLVDGIINNHYSKMDQLHSDLVAVINKEIQSLVSHGCSVIQIDEPVMMRYPDQAMDFGLDNLALCFEGVPSTVTKTIHLCCGYPDQLDTDIYPKAPKENYRRLAPKIDSLPFDQVSIEDAEARNDLSLLSLFQKTQVILGVVTVARTKVETEEDIRSRVEEALQHIPRSRLVLAPDCGLGMLDMNIIRAKLGNMVKVARSL